MHGDVDAVHVVDERTRLEPVAVRVVEAVDQRVLEQRAPALGLVRRALRARVLDRVEAADGPAADVVDDADRARPQQREPVVGDAAGVDDVAVEVTDQPGGADGLQVLGPRRGDEQPGDARVGVAEDHDVAVGPRLLGDPLVDDLLAVERGAPAEQIELARRAPGAAHAREHGHVAVVDIGCVRRPRPRLERERQAGLVGEVTERGLALVRAALVPGHLEEGRAFVDDAVRRNLHVDRDAGPVRGLHVVGRRGLGRRGEYEGCEDRSESGKALHCSPPVSIEPTLIARRWAPLYPEAAVR